jgi:hypothetical protein
MDRMFAIGVLFIGIAALIHSISGAYIDINYLRMNKADWEMIP